MIVFLCGVVTIKFFLDLNTQDFPCMLGLLAADTLGQIIFVLKDLFVI